MSRAETESLKKAYDILLPRCSSLHKAAERAASSHDKTSEIRRAIWEDVRKIIHGFPGDGYIFGGAAFARMPYGKAELHEPATWEPHQLAIALLSFDRMQEYETIEKKIKPNRNKKRSDSKLKRN